MSDTPDLDALARRYLDLWQDQMNRMANDPATADMMTRTFSLMTKSAQAFAAADATSRDQAPQQGTPSSDAAASPAPSSADSRPAASAADGGGRTAPHPDGTAPAAAVSGDGGLDLSWLLERLATLEARVAVLESRQPKAAPPSD